jgi:hypothetical protein
MTCRKTIVHTDTCEPFPVSRDRYKYFVTFTNDFTCFNCIFPMENRSDPKRSSKGSHGEWKDNVDGELKLEQRT